MSDEVKAVESMLEAEGIKSASGSSIEDLATQYGWHPEGEKSAEEFVKVALEKFPDQSKKIKQLFRTVEEMKDHMSKAESRAYEKAKVELETQRRQAIYDGDIARVEALDKAKEELAPAAFLQPSNQTHPAIAEFEERNASWINGTSYEELKMQQWVEAHGAILGRKKLPTEEHMALLEEHVKKEFSEYFEFESKEAVKSPVSHSRENVASTKSYKSGKAPTFNDLSLEQKQIARDFEKMGVMTIDSYIKDLVKHGELK